jgi:ubiquinone/menaquinone biosynthesis C-methylase UbiE
LRNVENDGRKTSNKLRCPYCLSESIMLKEKYAECNNCQKKYSATGNIINFYDSIETAEIIASSQPGLFENQKLYEFINFSILGLMKVRTDIDVNKYIQNKEVLDIGCGPKPYFYDPKLTSFHSGIDISINFLKRISGEIPESHFMKASADNLPFANNSFDVVLFLFALHHIPVDHARLIKEAYRVTRERIIVFDHNQSSGGLKKILKAVWWKFKDKGIHYNNQDEWNEILKNYIIVYKRLLGRFLENIFEFIILKKG